MEKGNKRKTKVTILMMGDYFCLWIEENMMCFCFDDIATWAWIWHTYMIIFVELYSREHMYDYDDCFQTFLLFRN